ncbi:MAG: hypothetical protein AAF741_16590 [Bacteroidota bacterium]
MFENPDQQSRENLKEAFLEVVENQLKADDPKITRQTLVRLTSEGISKKDAKKLIAQCVVTEIYEMQKRNELFNLKRYTRLLMNLPKKPS